MAERTEKLPITTDNPKRYVERLIQDINRIIDPGWRPGGGTRSKFQTLTDLALLAGMPGNLRFTDDDGEWSISLAYWDPSLEGYDAGAITIFIDGTLITPNAFQKTPDLAQPLMQPRENIISVSVDSWLAPQSGYQLDITAVCRFAAFMPIFDAILHLLITNEEMAPTNEQPALAGYADEAPERENMGDDEYGAICTLYMEHTPVPIIADQFACTPPRIYQVLRDEGGIHNGKPAQNSV